MFGQSRRIFLKIKLFLGNSFIVSLLLIKLLYMFMKFVSLISGYYIYI